METIVPPPLPQAFPQPLLPRCPDPCPPTTSGWVWFALAIALIALILVIIIYAFYFAEREDFLRVFDPVFTIQEITSTNKSIGGENFTLYRITDNAGTTTGDSVTLNLPSNGSKPGEWFVVSNLNDSTVTVTSGSGVTFQSFPTSAAPGAANGIVINGIVPPPLITSALLPAKQSWIIVWTDANGMALNVVPGGISQS